MAKPVEIGDQSHTSALEQWRADTPGCLHRTHLNNAGAALMPRQVLDAMTSHLQLESQIGGYEAADARADAIDRTYGEIAALVNASPRNMAIVANATAGFIQALSAFDFASGDAVVTSRCDYTSNQIQYLALARRLGVRVYHAEDLPEGGIDPRSVAELIERTRPRVVALSWIPTNSGLVQDVEAVGTVCENHGVPFIVDACQAVGQIPIDVSRLKCDYLSVTARKFLRGPRGIGFMFASDRALARGDHPLFVDMRGALWADTDRYQLVESARRFEDWEFPYALVLGLSEAARYARAADINFTQKRAFDLAAYAREGLAEIPGARVLDRGRVRCAIVTVALQGRDATDLVAALRTRGINTSASLRCYGILDFDEKGVESALRVSPHYYNTLDEVDLLLEALGEIARGPQSLRG